MPVQGPQQPGFWLPGAEYLALAPNTNIALQGRRRRFSAGPTINVPASTDNVNGINTITLETDFTNTSAIYLHYFWMILSPSLAGLVLINEFAGLTLRNTPFPDYPLGFSTLTNPTLQLGTVTLTDREQLITAKDILVSGFPPLGTTLSLQGQMNVNNPGASAITFTAQMGIIYTRLDGILE